MINIIISVDPSTKFLYQIIDEISSNSIEYNLIEVLPNDDSYNDCKEKISKFPKGSIVIFLGHGQSDRLYGGEKLENYPKKPLIKSNEMGIFKHQHLFLLACDSAKLIKSSFRISKAKKSIGFGSLPTEMDEITNNKKLASEGISKETIDLFKKLIIQTISTSLVKYFTNDNFDFIHLKEYLNLQLNYRINEAILKDRNSNLGDLLYQMRNEMVLY